MKKFTQEIETYIVDKSIFKIKSSEKIFEPVDEPIKLSGVSKRGAAPWGKDNNLPNTIVELIGDNPVASSSLEFKIDVAFGTGVKFGRNIKNEKTGKIEFVEYTFDEIQSDAKLKEIQTFFDDNDINEQFGENISDLFWFSNGFVEFIRNTENPVTRKITRLTAKEATYSRLEVANEKTGKIENHFYFAKWPEIPKKDEANITPVITSARDLEEKIGRRPIGIKSPKDDKKFRYVLPISLPSPGKLYYATPYYYAIIKSGWLDFANAIPKYKKAYMQNIISIKYIIEISEKYFPRIFHDEGITELDNKIARKQKEIDNINKYLKGVDAAGKSMITYFKSTPDGKEPIPEINIRVLDKKQGDEFLEDAHEASAMTFIAFRVHPSMIGVIPGKTTSNLSGSDKRELLRITQSLQSRIRQAALKPLNIVKKINNWPENIVFAVSDTILTTLDQGKEVQEITTS